MKKRKVLDNNQINGDVYDDDDDNNNVDDDYCQDVHEMSNFF